MTEPVTSAAAHEQDLERYYTGWERRFRKYLIVAGLALLPIYVLLYLIWRKP